MTFSVKLLCIFVTLSVAAVHGGGFDPDDNEVSFSETLDDRSLPCARDNASGFCTWHHQLSSWQRSKGDATNDIFVTDSNGQPFTVWASKTMGTAGPIGMGDYNLLYQLQSLNRERIPERMIHAKGICARGVFELTSAGLAPFTRAPLYSQVGKRYNCIFRWSTTVGGIGSSDTDVDVRGLAIKTQTPNGIVDFMTLSTPIFGLWDPFLFMSSIHAYKKNPQTNFYDHNSKWDFVIARPEALCHHLHVLSSRGCPSSWCRMPTHGIHTFTLSNEKDEKFLGRFHVDPVEGPEGMKEEVRETIRDEDHLGKKLWDQVAEGRRPCAWDLTWQVIRFEDAEKLMDLHQNPFDTTRTWNETRIPKLKVGRFTVTGFVENHFEFCECIAFDPTNLPAPGMELSCFDPIGDGRAFAYPDAQFYRLGSKFKQMHVNRPQSPVFNHFRDGRLTGGESQDGAPNYFPNTYDGSKVSKDRLSLTCGVIQGFYKRTDTLPFMQPFAECTKFMQQVNEMEPRRRDEELNMIAKRIAHEWKHVEKRLLKKLYALFSQFSCTLLSLITDKLVAFNNDPNINKIYCLKFLQENCGIRSEPSPVPPATTPAPRRPIPMPTIPRKAKPLPPPPKKTSTKRPIIREPQRPKNAIIQSMGFDDGNSEEYSYEI